MVVFLTLERYYKCEQNVWIGGSTMTLGEKLSKLRKQNNDTQEQLADILGVSRQAVSKWESNLTYPETDKLIRISELYNCSLDYLLKDAEETNDKKQSNEGIPFFRLKMNVRERVSDRTVWGMPLWHVSKNARGFFAAGLNARGVIAVGFKAKGIISLGFLSLGVLSIGLLSLGFLSLGLFALGILSAGSFSIGVLAAGSICFGIISLGAIAVGDFSVGAQAIGKYFALGDHARAMIALGDTKAAGDVFQKIGDLSEQDIAAVRQSLDTIVPSYLSWAKEIVQLFL